MAPALTEDGVLTPPLDTTFARVLLVGFAVVHVVLAVGPGPTPVAVTVLALVALIGATAAIVLPRQRRLEPRLTVLAVVLIVIGNVAVIPWLPGEGWPGYSSWPLGAGTIAAIGLTLRLRSAAAWVAMLGLTTACIVWSLRSGGNPLAGLGLVDRQIGVLIVGTLFAIGLRRAARAVEGFHAVERQQLLEQHLAEAEVQARRDAAHRVLDQAGTALERIATGLPLSADERAGIGALEGRLRDEIALAPLLSESLDHALSAARSRGVDVVVLTEPSVADLPTSTRVRAADWLASRLERATGAAFVGRIVLRGRSVRMTAAVDDDVELRMLEDGDA